MEDKSIIDRHQQESKFNLATALLDLESIIKGLKKRIEDLEGSMLFFVEELEGKNKNKLIVPDINEVNRFKKG